MATGMTQKEFAPRVGVSQQTLGHVLNGQLAAWPALKQRFAEELGRPVDELFPPTPARAPLRSSDPAVDRLLEERRTAGFPDHFVRWGA